MGNREESPKYFCVCLNYETKVETRESRSYEYPTIPNGLIDYKNNPKFADEFGKYEFLITVTMFNETSGELQKTLEAINSNLACFPDTVSQESIAVVVIVDGLEPFLRNFRNGASEDCSKLFDFEKIYERFPIHDEENNPQSDDRETRLLKTQIKIENHSKEFAHVFVSKLGNLKVFLCIKHQNKGKLNSHFWFFEGFCKVIEPTFCMLIDVGTIAQEKSLYFLYDAMNNNEEIAGVCGEIIPHLSEATLLDFPYYTQVIEYKFSHILDKSLESVLGYITVLPGAFSAFRWEALTKSGSGKEYQKKSDESAKEAEEKAKEKEEENSPLWKQYFIREPWEMNCENSNIYLAEDRVLCLALVSSKHHKYFLKYVSESRALTDPPKNLKTLLKQRRRWINGSWFALLDSVKNYKMIWKSKHSCGRKCVFSLQMLYYVFNVAYSFFMVGGYYLVLSICIKKYFSNQSTVTGLLSLYLAFVTATLILSIGSELDSAMQAFKVISVFFALYSFLFILLLICNFTTELGTLSVLLPILSVILCFLIIVGINKTPWNSFKGIIQFLLFSPTYINIFTIYAICNIHDVTWGNRPGGESKNEEGQKEDFELFRVGWVLLWAFTNGFFAYFLDAANATNAAYSNYIYVVGLIGMVILYLRFIGGVIYVCSKLSGNSRNQAPGSPSNQSFSRNN